MCFKLHKMGVKLNILSILLHPSQFVYNYIFNIFVFINFFDFLFIYIEKLETLFFCWLSRRPDHYPAHYICTGLIGLVNLDKISSHLRCCNTNLETAILNLNIPDNKNIHQAPLVSAQLVVALTIMVRATASCLRLTQ